MRVLNDRILVSRLDRQEVQFGSIVVPKMAVRDDYIGKVEMVGEEVKQVKVGDYVVIPVHLAIPISLRNVDYLVTQEKNVYVILDESEVI